MMASSLRLGPLLLCAAVALYRAVWLSVHLSGLVPSEVGPLLLADLPVLGALALAAGVEARIPPRWRLLPLLLSVGLVVLYLADVLAVFALNARLQIEDVRRFADEWWLIPSYVSFWSLAILALLIGSFFLRIRVSPRARQFGLWMALSLLAVPMAVPVRSVPAHLQKYTGSVFLLAKEIRGAPRAAVPHYRSSDFWAYVDDYEATFEAPFSETRKDIILIIVESLSAVDSHRTSGVRNILPRLDELSRKGMLFQNFFANFEASEGGIVALLSGVPPLHFPTASTDTFREYSRQRSVTATFSQRGYRCEFLTSVPLNFISMHHYSRSPIVGFSHAAGQKEIARYEGAPKYGFESPADHLLFEEVLARVDAARRARQPALVAAVTASSHPPFLDPAGKSNTEEGVWGYVQEELWWLYEELARRNFFDNGLLIITGDHRKMAPISEAERRRYGEGAKARIPLVIIGAGAPAGVVDDRLFQQADLLRMLDRGLRPGEPLSRFVVWVERYLYVFGMASNASNVQIFDSASASHQGYQLRLRGAEIDWLARPPNALAIERSIHRQRSLQQATRMARVNQPALRFGRDLVPHADRTGVLLGVSSDVDVTRDPDDPRGSLQTFQANDLDLDAARARAGITNAETPFTLTARAFLSVPRDGAYWFSSASDDQSCVAIDQQIVLGCQSGLNQGVAYLSAGLHRLDLRYVQHGGQSFMTLEWLPPGAKAFARVPMENLRAAVVE